VAYLFSAVSFAIIAIKSKNVRWNNGGKLTIALIAFLYSMWALGGSGEESVYWGFLLLMAGVPLYAWSKMRSN